MVVGLVQVAALTVAACTGGAPSPSGSTPAGTTSTAAGCRQPSPISRGSGFAEVHGSGDRISMWGLIMAVGPVDPVRTHEDVKIVWRITGTGPLRLTTLDPEGRARPLSWGPDRHLSSDYTRPGDEWGAGYRFTEPGCWILRATRGAAAADVRLDVAA